MESPSSGLPTVGPMQRWREEHPTATLGELHRLDPALTADVLAYHAEIAANTADVLARYAETAAEGGDS